MVYTRMVKDAFSQIEEEEELMDFLRNMVPTWGRCMRRPTKIYGALKRSSKARG